MWFFYDCRTPERGSRPNPNARKWRLYKYIQSYFPIKMIKTAELSPEHNYLIGYQIFFYFNTLYTVENVHKIAKK